MPGKQLASLLIEKSINSALDWAHNREALLAPLCGKSVIIHLHEIALPIIFHFSKQGLTVRLDQEGLYLKIPNELADDECWVSVSLFAINELQHKNKLTKLIKEGQLDFSGDLAILQSLSSMISNIELDLEEVLSNYISDAPAHLTVSTAKTVFRQLQDKLELSLNTLSDAALDEKKIGVREILLVNFVDEVRTLKTDADRLEAKLKRLEQRQASK